MKNISTIAASFIIGLSLAGGVTFAAWATNVWNAPDNWIADGEVISTQKIAENFEYLYAQKTDTPPICTGEGMVLQWDGDDWDCIDSNAVASGTVIDSQLFTASGTYTPNAEANSMYVMVMGAGGGGGGGGGNFTYGVPGGDGATYSALLATSGSVPITIGAGGSYGRRAADGRSAGGSGGATSFGSIIVAGGGSGGGLTNSTSLPAPAASGTVTTSPATADLGLTTSEGPSNTGEGGAAGRDWWGNGGSGGTGLVYIIELK